jgi:heptaprenyl diphosphate synthase
MRNSVKKTTLSALLTAFALIAYLLEGLLPPLFLPGARLGVSNVFILLCAYFCGGWYALVAVTLKTLLGSIFSGNLSSLMYSLPAGLLSLGLELILLFAVKKVSLLCASVAGAVVNITVQNFVFCLVTGYYEYLCFLPYLALTGVIAGVMVGLTVYLCLKKLPQRFFLRG